MPQFAIWIEKYSRNP